MPNLKWVAEMAQASFPDPAHWGPYQSPRAWHGELPKQDAAAVAWATWKSCQKGKDALGYITSMHLSNLRLSMFILHRYDSICLDQVYRTYRISCRVKERLWVCSEFATATWFVLIQDFSSCNEFDSSLHPMSALNTNNIIWYPLITINLWTCQSCNIKLYYIYIIYMFSQRVSQRIILESLAMKSWCFLNNVTCPSEVGSGEETGEKSAVIK